jgi:site-specific DNA recombinase
VPSPRQRCRDAGDQSARLARRDAEIGPELDRPIDAITHGVDLATIVPRIKALEGERDEIAAKLAQAGRAPDVITLTPPRLLVRLKSQKLIEG